MPTLRLLTCSILIVSLSVSCRQGVDKLESSTSDSTDTSDTTARVDVDNTKFIFDPDNEFLGLGVPEFGDLDSMIVRRKIRALVPYTHL